MKTGREVVIPMTDSEKSVRDFEDPGNTDYSISDIIMYGIYKLEVMMDVYCVHLLDKEWKLEAQMI